MEEATQGPGRLETINDAVIRHKEAAYALAREKFPGYFGIYFQVQRPTLNETEASLRPDSPATGADAAHDQLHATLEKLT